MTWRTTHIHHIIAGYALAGYALCTLLNVGIYPAGAQSKPGNADSAESAPISESDSHAGHDHSQTEQPGMPSMPAIPEEEKALLSKITLVDQQARQDPSSAGDARIRMIELLDKHQKDFPKSPYSPVSMQTLVTLHLQGDDVNAAESAMDRFIESRATPADRARAQMALAELQKSTGNLNAAIQTLKGIYARKADENVTRQAVLQLAGTLSENGNLSDARATLESHLPLEKDEMVANQFRLRLADLSIQEGKYDQAIGELDVLKKANMEGGPGEMRTILEAQAYFARGRENMSDSKKTEAAKSDLELAKKVYTGFIESRKTDTEPGSPTLALAYSAAADLYIMVQDLEGARKLYADMAQTFQGRPEAMYAQRSTKDLEWVGKDAPDFSGVGPDGKSLVKLSDFKGKYVFLDFWAMWCGPCVSELPNLVKLSEELTDQPFAIVSISLDPEERRSVVPKFIEKRAMNWAHVMDGKVWDSEIVKAYDVTGIPATFLIDPNGKILRAGLRGTHLTDTVVALMRTRGNATTPAGNPATTDKE